MSFLCGKNAAVLIDADADPGTNLVQEQAPVPTQTNSHPFSRIKGEMLTGRITGVVVWTKAGDPAVFLKKAAVVVEKGVNNLLNQGAIEGGRSRRNERWRSAVGYEMSKIMEGVVTIRVHLQQRTVWM